MLRGTAERLCEARDSEKPSRALLTLEKIVALSQGQLLAHLPIETLYTLAQKADEVVYEPGQALCRQGEPGDAVYIVLSGEAEVVQEREGEMRRIGFCRPGEWVGEMAILDPGPRMATVRAKQEPLTALVVQGTDFRTLLNHDAATSMSVIRLMVKRLRGANT